MPKSYVNKKTTKKLWTPEATQVLKDNYKYMTVPELMQLLGADEGRIRTKSTLNGFKLVRKGNQPLPRPEETANG